MSRLFALILFSVSLALPAVCQEIAIPFAQPQNVPYFVSQQLTIDSAEYDTLILRMDAKQAGTARLFFANHYDPQFNQQKSLWFFIKAGQHNYYLNLPNQNPNWVGWITGFILYPDMTPPAVKEAKVMKSNLITQLIGGWQEFWGPRGRLITGTTINTLQPVTLFGQSIFIYLYWLIALAAIVFFAWQRDWLKTGRFVFCVITAGWLLLETSSLFNNWLAIKDDWKYVGKSYPEKLALANTSDFYAFIEFCEANLSLSAKFNTRIPPLYNDLKARYYLCPRQHTTVEADYLVVYDPPADQTIPVGFKPFKIFREKAYIMKRRGHVTY